VDPKPQNGSDDFRYWAFISYSHADARWGDWLHKKLETYRVPRGLVGKPSRDGKVPRRLFPIFRDREELPVSSDLGANLKGSLEQSRYLVVICSPQAAGSRWVNEEVCYFKSRRGEDRLMCLIVDGEPNATDKPNSNLAECFPPAVRFRILPNGDLATERTEPIAADARPHADGNKRARFKLLAGLAGVSFDELWKRERRRRIHRALQYVGMIFCLTLVGATGWRWESQRISIAYYIEQGKKEMDAGRRLQASAYFAKARRAGGSGVALDQLLRESSKALVEPVAVLKSGHIAWITFAKFVDASHVITASADKTVRLWNLKTRESTVLFTELATVASANFSRDGERLVSAGWKGVCNVRARNGAVISALDHGSCRLNWAEFSPDGKRIVTASDDNIVRIWDLTHSGQVKPLVICGHEDFVKTAVFSPDGARVLTASFDMTARIWDATTGTQLVALGPHPAAVNAAVFSPDGKRVATACLNGNALVWDTKDANNPVKLHTFSAHAGKRANSVAFNPDGSRLLTTGDDRTAKIWDVATGDLLLSFEGHRDLVVDGTFSPDGHRVVTASKDKTAIVFDADPKTRTLDEMVTLAEKLAPETARNDLKAITVADK
jgi:dipeptidyl aminopeptidase/acylaminoacyl peptidase